MLLREGQAEVFRKCTSLQGTGCHVMNPTMLEIRECYSVVVKVGRVPLSVACRTIRTFRTVRIVTWGSKHTGTVAYIEGVALRNEMVLQCSLTLSVPNP